MKHPVPFLFAALVLLLPMLSLAQDTSQNEEFERQVACRIIIEDIRWSHRIWPAENATPKPPRSALITDQQIRSQVEKSLRMESALADIYGVEISDAMLQAELNRMASNSKDPRRLQELFDALGNNPLTLAECLARPALVARKLQNNYVWDSRVHGELRAEAEMSLSMGDDPDRLRASGAAVSLISYYRQGSAEDTSPGSLVTAEVENGMQRIELAEDRFNQEAARLAGTAALPVSMGDNNEPATYTGLRETETAFVAEKVLAMTVNRLDVQIMSWPKSDFAVWWRGNAEHYSPDTLAGNTFMTGSSLFIPAVATDTREFQTQAQGKVLGDTWAPVSAVPLARVAHTAVWTGTEMIVWGGSSFFSTLLRGGRYEPATDSWTATSSTGEPAVRSGHTAIWTGTEMIVWGGSDGAKGSLKNNLGI